MATTAVPAASRPLGSATTVPAHSMPVTSATSPKTPLRMYPSAWFSPNARTRISTSPAAGTGSGSSVTARTSGPPGSVMTMAFMTDPFLSDRSFIEPKVRPPGRAGAAGGVASRGGEWPLAEAGERGVDDGPQRLLVRVGLAHDHQAHAAGHQALAPGDRVDRGRDLAAPDGVAQRGGEAVLEPGHVPLHHRGDLGVYGGVLDGAVDQQAALPSLRAQQIAHQPVEVGANLRNRGPRALQVPEFLRDHQLGVAVQGSHQQGVLAARERRVQAARLHPGGPDQVVNRGGPVPALPELAHGGVQDLLGLELSRARHGSDNTRTIVQEQPGPGRITSSPPGSARPARPPSSSSASR